MLNTTSVISSSLQAAVRFIKILRLGKSDVQDVKEFSPFGIDGNPLKDMVALYASTGEKGKNYIVGYINRNQKAEAGELRLYSLDSDGNEKTYQHFKADGTIEVLGIGDNMVRYTPIDSALQQQALDINAELTKIAAAISSLGGAYAIDPITIDISDAQIKEIKTTTA